MKDGFSSNGSVYLEDSILYNLYSVSPELAIKTEKKMRKDPEVWAKYIETCRDITRERYGDDWTDQMIKDGHL